MTISYLTNIDLNLNEIRNPLAHKLGSDPTPTMGQFWYNTNTNLFKFYDGTNSIVLYLAATAATATTVVLRDGSGDFAAHDITANKVTGLTTPSSDSDAATKAYVDAAINGLDWKASVRVASTANVDVSAAPAAVDGVTLSANDRILLKDQSTGSQNGIYVFSAEGAALARSGDANVSAEVTGGLAVWVNAGTTNADTGWVLTTNDAITLATTSLTFTQFTGAGAVSVTSPIVKTGNTLSLDVVPLTLGGTGQATAAASFNALSPLTTLGDVLYGGASGAGTRLAGNTTTTKKFLTQTGNGSVSAAPSYEVLVLGDLPSGAVKSYATDVGDTSATAYVVTHSLGTRDVYVQIRDNTTPYAYVMADVEATSTSTVTVRFAVAPASNKYRVIVHA